MGGVNKDNKSEVKSREEHDKVKFRYLGINGFYFDPRRISIMCARENLIRLGKIDPEM